MQWKYAEICRLYATYAEIYILHILPLSYALPTLLTRIEICLCLVLLTWTAWAIPRALWAAPPGAARYNLLARAIKNKPFQCIDHDWRDYPQWRRSGSAARVEQGDLFKFYDRSRLLISAQVFESLRWHPSITAQAPSQSRGAQRLTGRLCHSPGLSNWLGMSCPSWQWHRTGYHWSPVRTLPVAPLWCDLCCSQTQAPANLRLTWIGPTKVMTRKLFFPWECKRSTSKITPILKNCTNISKQGKKKFLSHWHSLHFYS